MNSKQTNAAIAVALAITLSTIVGGIGQSTQFASATTIEEVDITNDNNNVPVNTVESVKNTHDAIIASIDATTDIPDEFNSRWTNPGTVAGDGGVTLFVVDCLPGEYPATPQYMLAEGVGILQQFVIGSGSNYLSVLYLVANFGDDDQVVKMGVTCIDEDGNESGDGDNDDESSVTRVTNNFVTNIINNIVNNINTNVTIITNNTNVTIIPPPPDTNGTDPGGNTTDPGGNTTDPGTGGNTTDPGTGGGNTTEALVIQDVESPGTTPSAIENTTDTTPDATVVEEEETETEEEETTNTSAEEPEIVNEETEQQEPETTEEETAEEEVVPVEEETAEEETTTSAGVGDGADE